MVLSTVVDQDFI